ncbi:hypothetical protein WR25_26772 [Diploscapter pachys]|uniref:Uncharacterized protein n=1 Tax=Diploscapter pachys TaxID=2018661 RepID=A0A2A2KZB0_9BILA|nr:hypothetical protein WR25_26772 [Diploscapter pachys]
MSEVPSNANEGCPGVGSENAGKASGCVGCPNQKSCASGEKPPSDVDIPKIQDRFRHIKHKILILSGKGGVGKVAILNIDICGPSQPRMMGVEGEQVHQSADGWTPVSVADNLTVMSIAFLLGDKNDAVIWRGARKNGMIKQFLKDVDWGEVDYLLIDTPPGTSDEHISVVQFLLQAGPLDGALIVSTPQEISLLDVRKEVSSIPDSVDFSRQTADQQREMCRASLLSLLAAEEAMSSADGIEDHSSTLVNIGACMADLEHIGATAEQIKKVEIRKISPYFVPRILNNLPAGYVAMK